MILGGTPILGNLHMVVSEHIYKKHFIEVHRKNELVGGFNPSEQYESQIGSSSQVLGKIKFMFQTTNQLPSGKLT